MRLLATGTISMTQPVLCLWFAHSTMILSRPAQAQISGTSLFSCPHCIILIAHLTPTTIFPGRLHQKTQFIAPLKVGGNVLLSRPGTQPSPPRTREREQTVAASQLSPTERPGNVYTKMPSVSINPPEKPSQRRNRIDHRSPPPTYTQPRPHPMFSNLDPNMIRVRFPQRPFERTIHCPPGGVVGTNRQRWYIVYVGRKVGIFNEWYVPHPINNPNMYSPW